MTVATYRAHAKMYGSKDFKIISHLKIHRKKPIIKIPPELCVNGTQLININNQN